MPEAEVLLRTEEFDLIVVSAQLGESERGRILSAAGETPTYVLPGLTLAAELLAKVERGCLRLPSTQTTLVGTASPLNTRSNAKVMRKRQCQNGTMWTTRMMPASCSSLPVTESAISG
jgi:hypothetical protein